MVNTPEHASRRLEQVKYPLPADVAGVRAQRGGASRTRTADYGVFGGPDIPAPATLA